MLVWYTSVFVILIANAFQIGSAQEDNDELSRTFVLHESERPCSFRRQQGYCKRRSECRKPTRQICRFGLNPVVCCLDEAERKTTTLATRRPPTTRRPTSRPTTPKRPNPKPDSIKEIDLTFPGCGKRIPIVQKPTTRKPSRNRGLFSRLGKRSVRFRAGFSRRFERNVQRVIVGGVTASPNSWPWMVALFKQNNPKIPKRFLCGASLISQKYVLTAAHCFDGERGQIDPSKFKIIVGAHSTNDGTEYSVQNILVHPTYKSRQYYNDLALLRIAQDVTLTQKVYPVCLPSDGLKDKIDLKNNNVTVTGWGDTSFGGVSSKYLQELTIPIVPLKECNESYSKLALTNFPQGINNLFICAGVKEGGKDACQSDSGGPLVNKLKDTSYAQLGIVSFGYGCAQAGFPGVYTRVSRYTKWLYDNTDLGK